MDGTQMKTVIEYMQGKKNIQINQLQLLHGNQSIN